MDMIPNTTVERQDFLGGQAWVAAVTPMMSEESPQDAENHQISREPFPNMAFFCSKSCVCASSQLCHAHAQTSAFCVRFCRKKNVTVTFQFGNVMHIYIYIIIQALAMSQNKGVSEIDRSRPSTNSPKEHNRCVLCCSDLGAAKAMEPPKIQEVVE